MVSDAEFPKVCLPPNIVNNAPFTPAPATAASTFTSRVSLSFTADFTALKLPFTSSALAGVWAVKLVRLPTWPAWTAWPASSSAATAAIFFIFISISPVRCSCRERGYCHCPSSQVISSQWAVAPLPVAGGAALPPPPPPHAANMQAASSSPSAASVLTVRILGIPQIGFELFFAAHQAVPVRVYSRDRRSANQGQP